LHGRFLMTTQDFLLYATFFVVVIIWAEVKGIDDE